MWRQPIAIAILAMFILMLILSPRSDQILSEEKPHGLVQGGRTLRTGPALRFSDIKTSALLMYCIHYDYIL